MKVVCARLCERPSRSLTVLSYSNAFRRWIPTVPGLEPREERPPFPPPLDAVPPVAPPDADAAPPDGNAPIRPTHAAGNNAAPSAATPNRLTRRGFAVARRNVESVVRCIAWKGTNGVVASGVAHLHTLKMPETGSC